MKKISNKLLGKSLLVLFLFALTSNAFSQETKKYDYAEIVVLQKGKKKEYTLVQSYVNSTTSSSLNNSQIEEVESISKLLQLMNENNWEFIDRFSHPNVTISSSTTMIWVNYIFRKEK